MPSRWLHDRSAHAGRAFEDFLGVRSANIRGRKRGIIAFGEPLLIDRPGSRDDVVRLGVELRRRVQALIDEIEADGNAD